MPRYAREGQKTAKCFYCGFQIKISSIKIRILARTEDSRTAREIVEKLKARRLSYKRLP